MSLRRLRAPVLAFVAGAVLTPAAAMAATGVFSSGSATPALRAVNTTAAGPAVQAQAGGSGNKAAIYAQNTALGPGSQALYARSYLTTGSHHGVHGVDSSPEGAGVRGDSDAPGGVGVLGSATNGAGVLAVTGVSGDGTAALLANGDAYVNGHLIDAGSNSGPTTSDITGTCTVAAGERSHACSNWTHQFPADALPRVVITPTSDPGGRYWVSETTALGFTIGLSAAASSPVEFNYVVVGQLFPNAVARPGTAAAQIARLRSR
jgi:hypothetical protein